jgi:hypothetical protein
VFGKVIRGSRKMSERKVTKLTDNKFVNLFDVYDPDNHCKSYQFAERRGKDSVAFICYDRTERRFLINNEFTPPTGKFNLRAFGGSLDKPDKKAWEIVQEEVEEEAGYKVNEENIEYVGKCFVSTQMNQECFLYLVFVDASKKTARIPENPIEALAKPTLINFRGILDNDDWKAIAIVMKAVDKRILKIITTDISIGE